VLKEYIEEREGSQYVAGTRVSLGSIVQCFQEGMSPESILGEFETLTLAQVYGAITYCLENQAEVDAQRVCAQQRARDSRRAAEPMPEQMRSRLEAARARIRSTER
jgi:uncharacterized protein (DUF433 family)